MCVCVRRALEIGNRKVSRPKKESNARSHWDNIEAQVDDALEKQRWIQMWFTFGQM